MARPFRQLPLAPSPAAVLLASAALDTAAFAQASGGTNESPFGAGFPVQTSAAVTKAPPPPVPVNVLAVPFPISGAIDDQLALLVEAAGKPLLGNVESGALAGALEAKAIDGTGTVV